MIVCSARVMVSSVDLLPWHENCRGSNEAGREEQMKDLAIHSTHFIKMKVEAMGW